MPNVQGGDVIWIIKGDDGPLQKALKSASTQAGALADSFMKHSKAIGISMTAAGGAITGALSFIVKGYANAGDELQKMAIRTGIGVESLSELKHAADLSGTSLESIEKATKKMAQAIYAAGDEAKRAGSAQVAASQEGSNAAQKAQAAYAKLHADLIRQFNERSQQIKAGIKNEQDAQAAKAEINKMSIDMQAKLSDAQTKMADTLSSITQKTQAAGEASGTYTAALGALGLKYEDLRGLSVEEQFDKLAFALADVSDAGTRAALAQGLFSEAGTELLPMLADGREGLAAMRQEARDLGLVFSQEAANQAAEFNDNLDRLWGSLKGAGYEIAEVLIPILNEWIPKIKEAVLGAVEWAKGHRDLIETIIKVTVVVGGLLSALGPVVVVLPGLIVAFQLLAGAMGFMGAAGGASALGGALGGGGGLIAMLAGPVGLAAAIGFAVLQIMKAIGAYKDWKQAQEELEQSTERANYTEGVAKDVIQEHVDKLKEKGVALDETAMATMTTREKINYLREVERGLSGDVGNTTGALYEQNGAMLQASDTMSNALVNSALNAAEAYHGLSAAAREALNEIRALQATQGGGGRGGFAAGGIVRAVSGAVLSAISGVQRFATGGNVMALVGERGPELAAFPSGTRIMSHSAMTEAVRGGTGGPSVSFNGPLVSVGQMGADPDRVSKQLFGMIKRELGARGLSLGVA